MLQVSYSFFNQLGPSMYLLYGACSDITNISLDTWFLVGVAARLALGRGLHTASTYVGMPVDMEQRRKRIFWSIYMMDRWVTLIFRDLGSAC